MTSWQRRMPVLLWAAIVIALCFPAVALLVRQDVLYYRDGFALLGGVAVCAAIIALTSGFALLYSQRTAPHVRWYPMLAILVLVVPLTVIVSHVMMVKRVPLIHDVTTDLENPPQFVHAPDIRSQAENALEYNPENRPLQREGYPEIDALKLSGDPEDVASRVQAGIDELGWQLTFQSDDGRHLEAVDTTFWFGFADDIVVRLEAMDGGLVRVDMRSVSRVGRSDLGKNADRIRRLFSLLK